MTYTIILLLVAAFAKSIMDRSSESQLRFGGSYWDKNLSWRGKWKNGHPLEGERFPGSSTVFVMFTDGWHLAQSIFLTSYALAFYLCDKLLHLAVGFVLFRVAFEIFYRWLRKRS